MLRTKILCTLGPATASEAVIRNLVEQGMDVARLNLSHGTHAEHAALIAFVRAAAEEAGRPIGILADLQGLKIRVGALARPIHLEAGDHVTLAFEDRASGSEIPTTYEDLPNDVEMGDRILVDDGRIELETVSVEGPAVRCEVLQGGTLGSHKGINIPSGALSAANVTEKDLEDLDFVLDQGVDYVGLSFVRRAADVLEAKERVAGRALVVAKIELARAIRAIDEIIEAADLVMIARGDLGVELPFEEVPLAQKRIIQKANFHGRPVITATQMLESMVDSPRPTRAEASDVANAVLDGTDAVMLSGETATGRYPIEALRALRRIAEEIESSGVLHWGPRYLSHMGLNDRGGATPREHAVAHATVDAVRFLNIPAAVVLTRSGFSARLVSSHRPPVPVFAVTTDGDTYRQLSAVWGVRPVLASEPEPSYESLVEFGRRAVLEAGVGRPGQSFVVTAGVPFHHPGTMNTMRVEQL